MSDITLRPRGATEIVDAAFALYRRNPGALIMLTAIGNVPGLVLTLIFRRQLETGPFGTAFFATMLVSMLTFALINAVMMKVGSALYLGGRVDVADALRSVVPKMPAIIMVTLLSSLAFGVGFLLLIAPALYFLARWFAVIPAIVLEDKGPLAAFSRSAALAKGRKWHILSTLVLVFGIYLVVSLGITMAVSFTGSIIVTTLLGTVYTIFAYPIVALCVMLQYYDARIRGEGFDVEYMTSTLGAAPFAGEPAPR